MGDVMEDVYTVEHTLKRLVCHMPLKWPSIAETYAAPGQ